MKKLACFSIAFYLGAVCFSNGMLFGDDVSEDHFAVHQVALTGPACVLPSLRNFYAQLKTLVELRELQHARSMTLIGGNSISRVKTTLAIFDWLAKDTYDWQQGFVPNFHSGMTTLEVMGAVSRPLDGADIELWSGIRQATWQVTVAPELIGVPVANLDDDEPIFVITNLPEGISEAYITKLRTVIVYADGTVSKSPIRN